MVRKPKNVAWVGFTPEQVELLDFLDFVGNNAWDRNGQTDELMPKLLADCADADLSLARIKQAMESVGYSRQALHPTRPVGVEANHGQVWPVASTGFA